MYITLGVLLVASAFFVSGRVRSDLVAVCALIILLLFGILTPEQALSGFSSPVIIMMVGLFVVSGGIFRTGLAGMISNRMLRLAGKSELRLFIMVMLVTSLVGTFVSNTGTVALMMPIVISMSAGAGMSASRFLMPLAFAGSIGGMFTLIGTPPNLVIDETLRAAGHEGLKFFSFAPVGAVSLVVGLLVLTPLSKKYLSKKKASGEDGVNGCKSLGELVSEYRLDSNMFRVQIPAESKAVGMTVTDINIRRAYSLNVLEIRRQPPSQSRFMRSVEQRMAAGVTFQAGDILYVTGSFGDVERMSGDYGLKILTSHNSELAAGQKQEKDKMDFYDIGIAEILLMTTSSIIHKTVDEVDFRHKYDINVLAIRRKREYILHDMHKVKFQAGDVLLVQGAWSDIGKLNVEQNEWVVMGQPLEEASKVTLDHKAPVAGIIMLLMVAAMVFDFIPVAPVTAIMTAAVLMIVTGCLKSVDAAYKSINWESIVLIAAMLPMSIALEETGTASLISQSLAGTLGQYGNTALLAGIYFTTSLMTMFISNTATAVLMAPIAMQAAASMGISPMPFLFAVTVGASMCFASPFSTPPNALVMPAGQYTFMDYIRVGLPLQVVMGIVMVFVLPLIFPF